MKSINLGNLSAVFSAVRQYVYLPLLELIGSKQDSISVSAGLSLVGNNLSLSAGDTIPLLWKMLGGIYFKYTDHESFWMNGISVSREEAVVIINAGQILGFGHLDGSDNTFGKKYNQSNPVKTNPAPFIREAIVWDNMFQDNENLVSAVIAPKTIIGTECFYGCSSLVRVSTMIENMPVEHLNTIAASEPDGAFRYCSSLRHLDGKVQLHVDDDSGYFSDTLCLIDCNYLPPSNFEYWILYSDVGEHNFDDFFDVRVWVGDMLFEAFITGTHPDGGSYDYSGLAARLLKKHIIICNSLGESIVSFIE